MTRLRVLVGAALLAGSLCASPALSAEAASGEQLSNSCTACHGIEGRGGSAVPALAGQPAADLVQKLIDFRDQKGNATIMNRIARGFTDDEIKALADYFSSIK